MNPASLTTLTEASRTFGATPTIPTPLRAAAIVPATWVPWSLVVGYQPVAERSGRPASVQLTESAVSMLWTRSGWSGSMPLSRTPTSTLREPSVILWAWSALIIVRSHCSDSRGSVVAAGDSSDSRSPLKAFFAPCFQPDAPRPQDAPATSGVPSDTATVRVAPTESTALAPFATTSARKVETLECAMTTPIGGHDWTTTPPAALTAVSTRRVWPGLAIRALTT